MRFLNSSLAALIVFGVGELSWSAETVDPSAVDTPRKTTLIFGYPFVAYSNLGVSNYFEYRLDGVEAHITAIQFEDLEEAQIFMEDRLVQFKSVFEPRRVDYPGQFSRSIECSAELKPIFLEKEIPNGRVAYFTGYAGSNKVAGVCSADLIEYKYIYALAICHSTNYLLEIEHFTEASQKKAEDNFLGRVTCADFPLRK